MKKPNQLFFVFLFITSLIFAQQPSNLKNDNTLEDQFEKVIDKSNNYQEFKVIKKVSLARLRKNILDTVADLEKTIVTANGTIDEQNTRISNLESQLNTTQGKLDTSIEKEDGIELFGILMKKGTYNIIMWGIIAFLLLGLALFIYKFKNSNIVTRDAKAKLAETESEFETHRAKKLEEIQQIRRKLQDEINKNRKA